ncbi:MAG: hypothetical protein A3D24_00385 [Candidatus Blackburnbacteria bacterium RIFCSPHIGHO2_02_FULL_39_13]|uniref:Phage holin family protein n=1 Tax=Candidatus Blackburnbacteria bacterium RIFCSPLOWO2_01_FULL_40_20 TaxID=1797519 RepID=A0A1G1VFQ7_9BACT|nr:MAG: Membrane protein [Microgenomates group bacterium GW2011_GWA2_39_19]OGY07537.1 MAG: hypothetical protein A2694_04745 [Candidatus Blackburnbacteria bacterium RIFCSPHIGHO2_01_FULL_40_17]OGY08620.1 MAG: hypothetical protein A3D24_00385 [Candidatus Blackburnbacteria bacterium RIFCSPHIGHO2_02_FULL_39_13]OGY14254.1 MAG: hypothetical protein A3A77_02140 [Candidatus Blackburnbacteria bacterium RIFCSPLOWO2_01_FULL_40_20]OGY14582.1 MAG: hypothetical protein A3I52_00340 [Candidatus Blackburnbacteri
MNLLFRLLINTVAILATAWLIPGIRISSFTTALIAALVLGILNTILKPILELLALPVNFLTFGLFSWAISAFVLWVASLLVPGFVVQGFLSALAGGIVLAFIASLLQSLVKK